MATDKKTTTKKQTNNNYKNTEETNNFVAVGKGLSFTPPAKKNKK